jgi:hypothetical protein
LTARPQWVAEPHGGQVDMAEPQHPFSTLLQPLVDEMAMDRPEPPPQKNRNHAVAGTWLLVTGVCGAHDFMARQGIDIPGFVTAFTGPPQGSASALGAPIICCVMALLGGLWLIDGVRNERASLDLMRVLWLCCFIGGSTYCFVAGVYVDNDPIASSYLRGFYLATFAASVMQLCLFARGAWELPEQNQWSERPATRAGVRGLGQIAAPSIR